MKARIWVLCIVLAAFAVPSFAKIDVWYDSSSYEQGQYMDNPCTSWQDWVWVNYSAYAETAQKTFGVDRYLVNESTTMGGMYAASGSAQADVGYANAFTIRNYHKVNTGDDFHVVTVVTVYPGSGSSVAVETACGNGMPDSKE